MASQPGLFNVQEFTDAGTPLANGRLYTYAYGTTTQKTAYTDQAGTVPHTYTSDGLGGQYIALNARGELPAPLYLATGDYDLALKRADGSTVWTRQAAGIGNDLQSSGGASLVGFIQAGAGAVLRTAQDKMRDVVSVKDFGAVGDGVADDTAAFNAFLTHANRGHIAAGTYKITGTLNFRSGQVITGDGPSAVVVYAASAPAASTPVLYFNGISNARAGGFCLTVPAATYTTARSIAMENATNCHAIDIVFSGGAGGNAAHLLSCTRCVVARVYTDDYRSNGFYVNGGYGNVIEDCDIPNGANGQMGIQLVGGEANTARGNRVALTPDNYFGIHAFGGKFPVVAENSVKNTRREAIALGGSQIGARVTNNTCYWDANLGTGDFGISVAGDDSNTIVAEFLIEGNTIVQSSYDGIGISGWCQRGIVARNVIRDSAQAALVTHQAGIKLYGWVAGAVVNDVVVYDNLIAKVSGGGLLYGVYEDAGLGSVSGNIVRGNKTTGLTGDLYRVTTNSVEALNHDDFTLRSSNATPTASTGSITSASGSISYQMVGKFVFCRVSVTISDNGTGATILQMPLPFTAVAGALSGAEISTGGKALKAGPSGGGSQLTITNYDNSYPGFSGATLSLVGVLQIG